MCNLLQSEYKEARLSVTSRTERTAACLARLQRGLTLLALTGVEDRLAERVPATLADLRAAGIKVRSVRRARVRACVRAACVLCVWSRGVVVLTGVPSACPV